MSTAAITAAPTGRCISAGGQRWKATENGYSLVVVRVVSEDAGTENHSPNISRKEL